jgi:hypothetical protein
MLVCGLIPALAAVGVALTRRERGTRQPEFKPLVGAVSSGSS